MRLFFAVVLYVFTSAGASAQTWEWIRTAGASQAGWQYGQGVARDQAGNLYITRNFLGSSTSSDTDLTSAGDNDGFIAKFSAEGTLIWAHRFGGQGSVFPLAIAVDGAGNSYVTGYYFGGSLTAGAVTLAAHVGDSFFVLKFNDQGNAVWGHRSGNSGDGTRGLGIAANAAGRVWVTGEYLSPTTVNGFAIGNVNSTWSGGFLLSLDTNGSILWGQAMGNASSNGRSLRGSSVAVDPADNAFIAGRLAGNINFPGIVVSSSSNTYNGFIAKFDTSGTLHWVNTTTGDNYAEVRGIAVDALGQAYVTGEFFYNLTVGSTQLTRAGGPLSTRDVWVAKLDAEGAFLWAIRGGGTGWDEGKGIALDRAGNAFVTGILQGSGTFGEVSFSTAGTSTDDAFVAKVNPAGTTLWVRTSGSLAMKSGRGLVVDPSGNSYVAGIVASPSSNARFGELTPTMGNGWHTFLVKLSSDGSSLPPAPILSAFSPASGHPGTTVTLSGNHLSGTARVTFNGVPATFTVLSGTQVSVVVPDEASTGPIQVTTLAGAANGPGVFTVPLFAPIISAVQPGTGKAGETVSVTGHNLGLATSVTLSGKAADFVVVSDEEIEITVPANAASGPLRVTTTGGSTFVSFAVQESAYWEWLTVFSGPGHVSAHKSLLDAEGNVYVVGSVSGQVSVGTLELSTTEGYRPFIVKLDSAGNPLWRHTASGPGTIWDFRTPALTISPTGEILFADNANFLSAFAGYSLEENLGSNSFIARLGTDGTPLGLRLYGRGTFNITALAANMSGEIYVLGRFWGFSSVFGSSVLTNMGGTADLLLLKLSSNGDILWLRQGRTPNEVDLTDLGLDAAGNVYLSGIFRESLQLGTTTLTNPGPSEVFIAKYNPDGALLWATRSTTTRSFADFMNSSAVFTVLPSGQSFLGGGISHVAGTSTLEFGTTALNLSETGSFLASFDSNGEPLWLRSLPLTAKGITLSNKKDIVLAGSQAGPNFTMGFGLVGLDQHGELLWTDPTGTGFTHDSFFRGVVVTADEKTILTGQFTTDLTIAGTNISHEGGMSAFVGRSTRSSANPGIYGVFLSALQIRSDAEWYYVDWFGLGWVWGQFYPWIYHLDHGWLYCAGNTEQVFLYDMSLGWLFTGPAYGNLFYRHSTGTWLLHSPSSSVATGGRWFFDHSTRTWRIEDAP